VETEHKRSNGAKGVNEAITPLLPRSLTDLSGL
jgi:hypothetical protein